MIPKDLLYKKPIYKEGSDYLNKTEIIQEAALKAGLTQKNISKALGWQRIQKCGIYLADLQIGFPKVWG